MFSVPKINKCCATCDNWQGARKKTCFGAETDTNSVRGQCSAGVHSLDTSGHKAFEGNYCKQFKKWREL